MPNIGSKKEKETKKREKKKNTLLLMLAKAYDFVPKTCVCVWASFGNRLPPPLLPLPLPKFGFLPYFFV
jgi:hypothetical protein